jgi:hypothetical protein
MLQPLPWALEHRLLLKLLVTILMHGQLHKAMVQARAQSSESNPVPHSHGPSVDPHYFPPLPIPTPLPRAPRSNRQPDRAARLRFQEDILVAQDLAHVVTLAALLREISANLDLALNLQHTIV